METIKSTIEAKMRACYETINLYKLYTDILPDDIYMFLSDLTTQLYQLEEEYDDICAKILLQKEQPKITKIDFCKIDFTKINFSKISLGEFKQACNELNLSIEQINELKIERRRSRNRLYTQKRRDRIKAMRDE